MPHQVLSQLLQLEQQVRQADSLTNLSFCICNQTHQVVVYDQAVLLLGKVGDHVEQEQELISLIDPKPAHDQQQSEQYIQILENKLSRIASTKEDRDNQSILASALQQEKQTLRWIGVVVIEGKPISYLEKLWKTTISVLIRESGF